MRRCVWIGLLEVRPSSPASALEGPAGAFVHALVHAIDEDDFKNKVRAELEKIDIQITSVQDVEPFEERLRSGTVKDHLRKLSSSVGKNNVVVFDEFHAYPH